MIQAFFVWLLGKVLAIFLLAVVILGIVLALIFKLVEKMEER